MSVKFIKNALIYILFLMLTACNDSDILENLTQEQANQVLAVLQQHNIPADKKGNLKSGYSVRVSYADNTSALSVINQYQLPWKSDVQIQNAFPDSSLVASPNAEQARVRSLQEQRLEQSLRIIAQIVNARVHMSYPSSTGDLSQKKSATHIGILISYKGDIDENMFIAQIKSLIKNSVDDIRYENISVVLFPAPVLQYTKPIQKENSIHSSLLLIFVGLLILSLIPMVLFYFKKKNATLEKIKSKEIMNDE